MNIGDTASVSTAFTDEMVKAFADLSQDANPIHLDEEAAAESVFGQRVVHGVLVSSLFSGLLGMKLPGEGTIYLGQSSKFLTPVFLGETITANVQVTEIRDDKPIAKLRTWCENDKGETVIDGEATVMFKR